MQQRVTYFGAKGAFKRVGFGIIGVRGLILGLILTLGAMISHAQADRITFWTHPHGDIVQWQNLLQELAQEFTRETGIAVQIETIPWTIAFSTWLAVAQGGAHPDAAEMYWLHSFSAIGGDRHGPMPLNDYKEEYWPDLEERFFPGSLVDVFWQDDFYGIPWRGDIRPMIYRTDIFEEHGLTRPPDTWDEIVEYALKLTERDARGNVTRWGFAFGGAGDNPVTSLMPYYWQAGGEFMTEDGRTATIDNAEMRLTLEWMRDLVWKYQVVSPEFMERGFDPQGGFIAGTIAMIGSVSDIWGTVLERDFPELDGKWAMALSAKGPASRATFSGAGYYGVLRGSQRVEESVRWIHFLSRDENMQRLSEVSGRVSPNRRVMASEFWQDRPWKRVLAASLEHAHTSQHPSPAWSVIANPEPGAVLYDMFYDAIIRREPIDEVVTRAQRRMQDQLDRAFEGLGTN